MSPEIKVTFLGTGTSQGVPLIACRCPVCMSVNPKDKRLRSAIQIDTSDNVFVIDSGPDFRQQMLRAGTMRLDGLIFTHEHKDHIAGMDDIRAFNFHTRQPVDVYATERVQEALKREYHYIFSGAAYPGIPDVRLHTITNDPFVINNTRFIPVEVLHYKMKVLGFRINDFTYITDANYISDQEKEKIKGSKVLVLNALRREPHISHFTLSEAIAVAQEIGAEKTYFTHISHQLGLHDDVMKELPKGIELAWDGMEVSL